MSELDGNRIYDKLETIDSKVDELLTWKTQHVASHVLIERDVGENRKALFSNPGIVSKVTALWNCKSDITNARKFWFEILKYLIVATIVGVVAWLLVLYKKG